MTTYTLGDTMETIARQAIRISQLEAENAALKTQVESLRRSHSKDQVRDLKRQLSKTENLHPTIQAAHTGCARHVEEMEKKYREAKRRCQAWKDYVDRQVPKEKSKALDQVPNPNPPMTPTAESESKLRASSTAEVSNLLPEHVLEHATATEVVDPPSSPPLRTTSPSFFPRVTSSQTTAENPDKEDVQQLQAGLASSSDNEPVFVSARPAKRRAGVSTAEPPSRRIRIKQEPTSPDAPIEVNSDDSENSKQTPRSLQRLLTSDLDAIASPILTPRHPRRADGMRQRAISEDAKRPVLKLERNSSSWSEGDLRAIVKSVDRDGPQRVSNPSERKDSNQRSTAITPRGILQQISTNLPSSKPASKRRSRTKDVAMLSEDGEHDRGQIKTESGHEEAARSRPTADRLEELLNTRSPEKTATFLRRPLHPEPLNSNDKSIAQRPTNSGRDATRVSPIRKSKSLVKQFDRPRDSPPPLKPDDEPLRLRDPRNLHLDDFRINPKYLGSNFAFADTLRGRDQRRNLHTCTRPDCCGGALQKVISLGGTALTGKTDAEALEAFLGPQWEDHIGAYGPDQKKEIVLQAHTFCFANQHGKHRPAFERRNTPPGFWDTDFPSTQQIEQNRAKAQEMERQQVQDRWREALREGGRWKFRDE